jgi:hypothetical protein
LLVHSNFSGAVLVLPEWVSAWFDVGRTVIKDGRVTREIIGPPLLASRIVGGDVATLEASRLGAVGRRGVGWLLSGEIGSAQVFAAFVHRWASL